LAPHHPQIAKILTYLAESYGRLGAIEEAMSLQ